MQSSRSTDKGRLPVFHTAWSPSLWAPTCSSAGRIPWTQTSPARRCTVSPLSTSFHLTSACVISSRRAIPRLVVVTTISNDPSVRNITCRYTASRIAAAVCVPTVSGSSISTSPIKWWRASRPGDAFACSAARRRRNRLPADQPGRRRIPSHPINVRHERASFVTDVAGSVRQSGALQAPSPMKSQSFRVRSRLRTL